jgi:hypothetical protein
MIIFRVLLVLYQINSHFIPLDNYLNILYTANIGIGTPSQYFDLAVDTSSFVRPI